MRVRKMYPTIATPHKAQVSNFVMNYLIYSTNSLFVIDHLKPASNAHVTKIMKRIRSKLEGVDFGIQHKMSVNEQVSRSIDQAMSVDNLCMMYEGWTSWV